MLTRALMPPIIEMPRLHYAMMPRHYAIVIMPMMSRCLL